MKILAWAVLVIGALALTFAPVVPRPHLTEKLAMFMAGTLVRPRDYLDLALHAAPLVVLTERIVRGWVRREHRG